MREPVRTVKSQELEYDLPESLVAQRPLRARDGARLLVLDGDGIAHRAMRDWAQLVPGGALVVLNDTRVFKARLLGRRKDSGGKAELLLLRSLGERGEAQVWEALGRARRPLRPGMRLVFGAVEAVVVARLDGGGLRVELTCDESVTEALEEVARVPLPPYIRRPDDEADVERYQTLFAKRSGSVAAPTAGLHMSQALLRALGQRGVKIAYATLHVGPGTFQPVSTDDLDDHPMHAEALEVSDELVREVAQARARQAPVIAVGTTVVRALETAADPELDGHVIATSGETRLMIQPGREIRVVDGLLTNFHMPRSTLLALVAAFVGIDRVLAAYRVAIEEGYRFLSYGDAMYLPPRRT